MATIKAMREMAKASKQINNHPDMRIQVAERKDGKGYNTYRCYGNEYFQDGEDETTIGFINQPLSFKGIEEWLEMA
jgi:uncharacterized protein (DUF736 family)